MFYRCVRSFVRLILRCYFRWEVEGKHNMPSTGGVVLVANHVSYMDPPVMGCAVDREVYFMAKQELFSIPVLSWLIRHLHAFPVRRQGVDRAAIRNALNLLKRGEVVGLFPEGTRGDGRKLLEPQNGAILLAVKAGVPIVPMAIVGTENVVPAGKYWPRRAKIRVILGSPLRIPATEKRLEKEMLQKYSQEVMQRIKELWLRYCTVA